MKQRELRKVLEGLGLEYFESSGFTHYASYQSRFLMVAMYNSSRTEPVVARTSWNGWGIEVMVHASAYVHKCNECPKKRMATNIERTLRKILAIREHGVVVMVVDTDGEPLDY